MMNQSASDFVITSAHDKLLRSLHRLYMLTARQLTTLHYSPGTINTVKERLKTLGDSGYVQAREIPSTQMRMPFYYTLGKEGMRYLESVGCDMPESWRASKEADKHALFVEHTLELNDLLISALLLRGNARLHSLTHERVLKRQPYKASWNGGTFTVIPDAFLDFYVTVDGVVRRMPVLLEHDRGTEEQSYFRRRIRAYMMLLKTGSYQQLFGANAVTVAFTTFQGEGRAEQMGKWALLELEPSLVGLFRFVSLTPPLDPVQTWRAIL